MRGYNPQDHYFKKAKKEHYAARSIYKLEEIDRKHRLFKNGDFVLDLGASPGSWSQYVSQRVGSSGRVIGLDLKPINITLPNAEFFVADIRESAWEKFLLGDGAEKRFDSVLSDMAPNTTGIRITDQSRSFELASLAWDAAQKHLKPGGHFVVKVLEGPDIQEFRRNLVGQFEKVVIVRPESTRKTSTEIFLVGIKYALSSKQA